MKVKTVSPASVRFEVEPVKVTASATRKCYNRSSSDFNISRGATRICTLIAPQAEAQAMRYDPVAIAEYYRRKQLQVLGRIIKVLWPSFVFALGLWWDRQRGRVESKSAATGNPTKATVDPTGSSLYQDRTSPVYPTRSSSSPVSRRTKQTARPVASLS